jgi:hypothetical protein
MYSPFDKQQFRQGDVLIELVTVTQIPAEAKKQESSRQVTLANGEMTGHKHVLETQDPADWWSREGEANGSLTSGQGASDIFVSIPSGGTVNHPEHNPISLPPGVYRVTHQREYSPATPTTFRRVAD